MIFGPYKCYKYAIRGLNNSLFLREIWAIMDLDDSMSLSLCELERGIGTIFMTEDFFDCQLAGMIFNRSKYAVKHKYYIILYYTKLQQRVCKFMRIRVKLWKFELLICRYSKLEKC